ncbi:MAG: ABC-F family ATP-binding cassette domain-containing protein [Verrucomicrobia bacterium]|nr:ABC-F family ATP-binding cassette domain-containing protein [Verrucomicrobiota bacterium]MDA1088556.1 ABC-F family ATP-binding cassette domain-containing protein [Verrucomicrobiota bacterium]
MIDFVNVSVRHGAQEVLREISLRINPGEHVGILGPNGAGKSTLFQLLLGEVMPTTGDVSMPSAARIGHVRQQLEAAVKETSLRDFAADAIPELGTIHDDITEAEEAIATSEGAARDQLLKRIGRLQSEFEHLGGYEMESRAEVVLGGLGYAADAMQRALSEFSGGWQKRAELARAIIARPDVLLLDEPSNYLDLPAIEWLQRYLREFSGTLLLISHDRYLLRALTSTTCEVAERRVTRYAGGYDYYVREREQRYSQAISARENQERRKEQIERFVERFRHKATKASQVQSRIKMLERMEDIDAPQQTREVSAIHIADAPRAGAEIIRIEQAGLTYDDDHWVLRGLDIRIPRGRKVAVVGYNGMGKTTLLRMLAGTLALSEGKRVVGHHVVPGYQSQESAETLPPDRSVFDIVHDACPDPQGRNLRTMLGAFGFTGDEVDKPCGVLSGGERIRLAFARLFVNPPNLLILDEPTTHLDLQGRQALERALSAYSGTICLVSHDVEFVRNVANHIIAIEPPGVKEYPGGYDYYHEKSAETDVASAQPAAPAQPGAAAASAPAAPRKSAKDLRRERAQQRQSRHEQARRLKKQVAADEVQIGVLETAQAGLLEEIGAAGPGFDYQTANKRMKTIQDEIAQRTQRWEAASQELEQLA